MKQLKLRLSKHKSVLIDAALVLGIFVSGTLTYRSCMQLSLQDRPASKASQQTVNKDTLWSAPSKNDTAWQTLEVTLPMIHFPAAADSQSADTLNTNEKE